MKEGIDQIVQKIIDKHDPEELCDYCIYGHDCSGPVTSYGNGPIFAPCADSDPEDWLDIDLYIEGEIEMFKIKKIIYNNPATIVWFADGDKVVVKTHNEKFDKEKGVAMAIARKFYGRSEFVRIVESGENQLEKRLDKVFKETARRDFELNKEEN